MKLRRITALFLLFTAIGVAACAPEGGDSAGVTVDEPIGAPEPGPDYAGDTGGGQSNSTARSAAPTVVKNASIHMEVVKGRLNSAAQEVVDVATSTSVGGFLVSSVVDTGDGYGFGNIVVKVPAPRFERVVADLDAVGKVTRQQLEGQDLTPEFLANQAAMRRTRGRIAALLRRLDEAPEPAVRFELREDLRAEWEQLRNLRDNESHISTTSAYSTIEVALAGTAPPAPPEKPAFERALGTAKDITLGIASGIVLAAGVLVPIGALVVVLYLVGAPVVRRLKPRLKADPF